MFWQTQLKNKNENYVTRSGCVRTLLVYIYDSFPYFNFLLVLCYTYVSITTIVVVQSLSHVRLFATPWTAAYQASLFFTISLNLLKSMSIEKVMLCNHFILFNASLLCLLSFPEPGPFPMSWLFTSGGQSIGASASVLPMNIQGWFPLWLTSLIFLLSRELSRVFSSNSVWKINSLVLSNFMVQLLHLYMTTGKTIDLTRQIFVGKVMFLLFNMHKDDLIFTNNIKITASCEKKLKIKKNKAINMWVAIPFSKGSSQPRNRTQVSYIAGGLFTSWAMREAPEYWSV